MIKINLVPREILDQDVQRQRALQAGIVVGALLLVVAGFSVVRWRKAGSLEAQQAEKQKQYDALQAIKAEADQLEAQARSVKSRLDTIMSLLKGRPLYVYFMQDFAATLPPQIWVTSVNTAAGKGRGELAVTLSATSLTSEAIAEWLRVLEKSGKFKTPVLSAISFASTLEGGKLHSFTITTTYVTDKI